ncbi:interleukin-15 receptor subunit alpha isoform X4 [Clupea harengus]|uniref:Interleukin-15 receptor subunit alpha isoform X4 n=1 Tax=Clupea harengus TaxID=7950 RepID=A0A6P8GGC9_CLUHA|nr:interleukin-15 receptor subunit alpha isoform X4 [Clupea harengus]
MILKSVLVLLIVHKLKVTRAEGCGPPPVVEHTKPIEGTFPLNHKLRYECVTGFVRKAGTSNRITCNIIASQYVWHTGLPLTCIAKPFAITEPKVDLQDFTTNPAFYNQSAVVSGSVSAVFILLAVGLLLIFTKKALPWQQRRNTTDRPATYRRVAVGTTSHANTNPSCGISLSEQEASDGPDPAP